jgi:hypothetical protein
VTVPFPPQFFILLGIDIFLGGSLATVIFDQEFPMWLPYSLDFCALAGFLQLYLSPNYLVGYPVNIQFYYSAAYAVIAIMSLVVANLHLLLIKHEKIIGGAFAIMATVPSILAMVYFVSAFVNDYVTPLPLFPLMPPDVIWAAFVAVVVILVIAMVVSVRSRAMKSGSSR